jgi:hypothetical protein
MPKTWVGTLAGLFFFAEVFTHHLRELDRSTSVEKRPPVTLERLRLCEERRIGGGEDYCSKIKAAGFASFIVITTNFDGDTMYMM